MNILATKLFTKILVLPTIFGFALTCCQPIFVQVESNDTISKQAPSKPHSHVDGLMVEEGHDCDHDDHHGQSSLQAPTQNSLWISLFQGCILIDLALSIFDH